MAFNRVLNTALISPYVSPEGTPGDVSTDDFIKLACNEATVEASADTVMPINAGELGPTASYTTGENVTGTISGPVRLGGDALMALMAAAMRDSALPAGVSSVISSLEFEIGVTLADGYVGGSRLKIAGTTTGFDAFTAASSNSTVGLGIVVIGSTSNDYGVRGPCVVLGTPYDDATDSYLDLDPRFRNGASGVGSEVVDDVDSNVTLNIGSALIAKTVEEPGGTSTFSMTGNIFTSKHHLVTGMVLGFPSFSMAGKEVLSFSIPYVAHSGQTYVDDPLDPGSDRVDGDAFLFKPMTGGVHLEQIIIGNDDDTFVLDSGVITQFDVNLGGEAQTINDGAGSVRPIGFFQNRTTDPKLTMTYYQTNSVNVEKLAKLSQLDTRKDVSFQLWMHDDNDTKFCLTFPNGSPGFSLSSIGSSSDQAATLSFEMSLNLGRNGILYAFQIF